MEGWRRMMLVGDTLWGLDSGDKLLALRDVTPDNIQGGQTTRKPYTNNDDDFLVRREPGQSVPSVRQLQTV